MGSISPPSGPFSGRGRNSNRPPNRARFGKSAGSFSPNGREVTASDVAAGGQVAVVNQAFLTRFNLGVADAIGKRLELFGYGAGSCLGGFVFSDTIRFTIR